MKKIIALILSLVFVVSFTACGDKNDKKETAKKQAKSDAQVIEEKATGKTDQETASTDTSNQESANENNSSLTVTPENTSEQPKEAGTPVTPSEPVENTSNEVKVPEKRDDVQAIPPEGVDPNEFMPDEAQLKEDTSEWKQFLKEYDKWADSYVTTMKKLSQDPSDEVVVADFQTKLRELSGWEARSGEVQMRLEGKSKEDMLKYQEELTKIISKIAEVSPQPTEVEAPAKE